MTASFFPLPWTVCYLQNNSISTNCKRNSYNGGVLCYFLLTHLMLLDGEEKTAAAIGFCRAVHTLALGSVVTALWEVARLAFVLLLISADASLGTHTKVVGK